MRFSNAILLFVCFLLSALSSVFAQKPELVVPSGHTAWVTDYAVSGRGKYLVTASYDNTVKLWDFASKREVKTLYGHKDVVSAVTISKDENLIASAAWDGIVKLWDVRTGKFLKDVYKEHQVNSLAISPDGKLLASASGLNRVLIYSLEEDSLLWELELFGAGLKVEFFPDSKRIAVLDDNEPGQVRELTVYSTYTGEYIESQSYSYFHGDIMDFSISADGKHIYNTVHTDSLNVRVHEVATNKDILRLHGHQYIPQSVSGSDTGSTFFTTANYTQQGKKITEVKKWDWKKGICLDSMIVGQAAGAITYKIRYAANLGQLLIPNSSTTFRVLETYSFADIGLLGGRTSLINQFYEFPGHRFVTTGDDGPVKEIDLKTGNFKVMQPNKAVNGMKRSVLLKDKRTIITLAYQDSAIYKMDISTGVRVPLIAGKTTISSMALSPNEELLAVYINEFRTGKNSIIVYSLSSGQEVQKLVYEKPEGRNLYLDELHFLPDSKRLIFTNSAQTDTIPVWTIASNSIHYLTDPSFTKVSIRNLTHYNDTLLLATSWSGSYLLWNTKTYRLERSWTTDSVGVTSVTVGHEQRQVLTGSENGIIRLWDTATWQEKKQFRSNSSWVSSVGFTSLPDVIYSYGADNFLHFWNTVTGAELLKISLLDTIQPVVIRPDGLFDASPEAMKLMYFVVNDASDADEPWKIIELSQLKHRYYQPELLKIQLGFSKQMLRSVPAFVNVELAPKVTSNINADELHLNLKNQGGGIGRVAVYINDAEVIEDARPEKESDKLLPELTLKLDLNRFENRFAPGQQTNIKVIAWNGENWLNSRPVLQTYSPVQAKGVAPKPNTERPKAEKPRLFALVFGTSDYAGTQIDLKYASKDAVDVASALKQSAANLFGTSEVEMNLYHSDAISQENQPTRQNLIDCLAALEKKMKPQDILVVYLSGHGVNSGGADGDFYYLTNQSAGADAGYLADPFVRQNFAISSSELTGYLNNITASKKIMILDACASGKAAETMLTTSREVPASQVRALDRMKDRTGFYILAGSAADAVSYESSVYGQGLLTYSLLKAMKGSALRTDGGEEYVDIQRLLQFAVDEVPELAKGIGGIQKPLYRSPDNQQSFDIGKMDLASKQQIVIAEPKPVFVATSFQNRKKLFDNLQLSDKLNAYFRENTTKGKAASLVFLDAKEYPGAYSVSGYYQQKGKDIVLNYVLVKDQQVIGKAREFRYKIDNQENMGQPFLEQLMNDIR